MFAGSGDGSVTRLSLEAFLAFDMSKKVILHIILPVLNVSHYVVKTYKVCVVLRVARVVSGSVGVSVAFGPVSRRTYTGFEPRLNCDFLFVLYTSFCISFLYSLTHADVQNTVESLSFKQISISLKLLSSNVCSSSNKLSSSRFWLCCV